MKKISPKPFWLIPAALLFALPCASIAQTYNWTGNLTGTNSWRVDANWGGTPNAFPDLTDDVATLSADFTGGTNIDLNATTTVGSLSLDDTGATGDSIITVRSGTGTNNLVFSSSGNATLSTFTGNASHVISSGILLNSNLNISTGSALTLSGVISDGGAAKGITKVTPGGTALIAITLSGNNTFSGGVTTQLGNINYGHNNALGTGNFTFANPVGGIGNGLNLNSAFSRILANNIILNNSANVTATQYATIGFDGGASGYRTVSLTGNFTVGPDAHSTAHILFDADGNPTGLNEGTYFVSGNWTTFARPNTNTARVAGGSFVIDSANSIAPSGVYRLEGALTHVSSKIILNGAYTMPALAEVRASNNSGLRNAFGARNAASTTANITGFVNNLGTVGVNLFSQNPGAILEFSGNIGGSPGGPVRINDAYTFTSADSTNSLQVPTGIVRLSRLTGTNGAQPFTILNGTLRVNNTSGSGTGNNTVTVGGVGAAVTAVSGSYINTSTSATLSTRVISNVNTATAQTLQVGQAISGANIPLGSIITGIGIGSGAGNSTIVVDKTNVIPINTTQNMTDIATVASVTAASLGGTGIIVPTGTNGLLVNNGSSIDLADGVTDDFEINLAGTGNATFSTGAKFNFEVAALGTSDSVKLTGLADSVVTFNSNVVNLTGITGYAPGTYTLFTFDTAPAPALVSPLVAGTMPAGLTFTSFDYSVPTRIQVTLAAAPTPSAPAGLAAIAGNNLVNLSWTANSAVVTYTVKRSTISGSGYTDVTTTVTGNTYTDTGVTNGTTYFYVISGTNFSGTSSDSSEVSVTPVPPPAAPTGLSATPGNALVNLSWSASAGATSYTVKRAAVTGGPYTDVTTAVTGTTYTDTGRTNGTTYFYVVAAVSASGSSVNSAEASATPVAPPVAPTSLTATPGDALVNLSWTAASGATSYTVRRSTTSGSGYVDAATNVSGTTYSDTGLTNGTTYYYVVAAVNAGGTGANSTQASATPVLPAPAAPTGLTATAGDASVGLSWSASAGAATYTIERSPNDNASFSVISSGSITGTTYNDTGLTNGTLYFYRVTAVNTGGSSAASNEASATPVTANLFAAWKALKFTAPELLDSAISGNTADPDKDGIVNLVEYATGTEPRTANASPVTLAPVSGVLNLTFTRIVDAKLTYTIKATDNLVTGFTTTPATYPGDFAGSTTYIDTGFPLATTPRRFLRLEVTLAP